VDTYKKQNKQSINRNGSNVFKAMLGVVSGSYAHQTTKVGLFGTRLAHSGGWVNYTASEFYYGHKFSSCVPAVRQRGDR